MGEVSPELAPEAEPVLRGVLYPAQVTLPNGQVLRRAKLAVTQTRVYVFTAPDVAAYVGAYSDATLPGSLAPRSARWLVQTDDGELSAQRMSGCGCGIALKTWHPFTPERWGATV